MLHECTFDQCTHHVYSILFRYQCDVKDFAVGKTDEVRGNYNESNQFRLDEPQTLVEKLTAAIQADILEGRIPSRRSPRGNCVSQKYEVSRTPIREALRQLAATQLVELRPRLGAVVASPTAGEVIDLFELVAELEGWLRGSQRNAWDEANLTAIRTPTLHANWQREETMRPLSTV